jgi:hypothetical protein
MISTDSSNFGEVNVFMSYSFKVLEEVKIYHLPVIVGTDSALIGKEP